MREDVCGAGERHRQDELLVAWVEARLVTEGERRPDLDPPGAGHERFLGTLAPAAKTEAPVLGASRDRRRLAPRKPARPRWRAGGGRGAARWGLQPSGPPRRSRPPARSPFSRAPARA